MFYAFFFLILCCFNGSFTFHSVFKNTKLKLELAILIIAPIRLANEAVETPPHVAGKQLNIYQKSQK